MPEYTVFIGRFSPFHAGHFEVVREALQVSSKLIMFLGSADSPRESRNPFTYQERVAIIRSALADAVYHDIIGLEDVDRIIFRPANDYPYNDTRWVTQIVDQVNQIWEDDGWHASPKHDSIALIGHKKDHTSYYLDMFPQWSSLGVKHYAGLNATDIRTILYDNPSYMHYKFVIKPFVIGDSHESAIWKLFLTNEFAAMVEEGQFIQKTKQAWSAAPYPVTFVTVDAVVTCAHHLLLIQRRAAPGKGLFAIPGGYLDVKERIVDSMLRELDEETKINVPKKVLLGSIVNNKVYDAVERSARGRVITHAYHINLKLESGQKFPKIKGSDDAVKAKWFPLSDVKKMKSQLFEDHWSVIDDMLGGL